MTYTATLNRNSNFCTVLLEGTYTRPTDCFKLQDLALEIMRDAGISRFLFDMRKVTILGDSLDTFKAATTNEKGNLLIQLWAYVFPEINHSHKFLENVYVNRGYQVKVFDCYDEAKNWLGS